ncbi:MAG: MmgE/PrpD family protein [Alphaproteobacteria bacterium]|nr:MmgE/PrpD family protein [Alphaproteobacteria bacterium]
MTDDPAWSLAQHVCRTGYADLPASAIQSARRDILDTFGCMLGGSGSPGIAELCGVIGGWSGREESRVLLRGLRLPAPQAALLNASMGHALDFDDTLDTGGSIHPGVSVLACALALTDRRGGVSGRDVLLAVALGLDVSCRIALASTLDRGWHRTAAIGVFGAAAAAGKIIGLTPPQMLHALGIAYAHAAGNRQCILDGALTKRLQAGQAASAGVFSAVLAQTGFTGAQNIFNGRFGFFELYQPNGHDASLLLRDLGTVFCGEALSYKPYPCGRPLHAAIDTALAARAHLGIAGGHDIEAVTIEADPAGHAEQFGGAPAKRRPTQVVEAQFAQPFLVATALVRGKVGIADVAGLGDTDVLALSDRIAGVARESRARGSLSITVRRTGGHSVTIEAADPIGSPQRPLSDAQLEAKFRDCAHNALRQLPEAEIDAALAKVKCLETVADARGLLAPLAK